MKKYFIRITRFRKFISLIVFCAVLLLMNFSIVYSNDDCDDGDCEQSGKFGTGCSECSPGDFLSYIYISVSDEIQKRTPEGVLVSKFTANFNAQLTGIASDNEGRIFAADTYSNKVLIFDDKNKINRSFADINSYPVSIQVDYLSNINIANLSSNEIRRFDNSGKFLNVILLKESFNGFTFYPDKGTLLYSTKGGEIKSMDVYSGTSEAVSFSNGFTENGYTIKILNSGDMLIADGQEIIKLNSSGKLIQTYDIPEHDHWYALTPDPDGLSFWSADYCNSNVWRFDIASGNPISHFNTGTASGTVFGLLVRNEIIQEPGIKLETAVLNLKAAIERPSDTEEIINVSLRNTSPPYETVDQQTGTIGKDGICSPLTFSDLIKGKDYYIVVNHMKSIERWSREKVSFDNSPVNYEFTSEPDQILNTGDMNQDGIIDLSDIAIIYNEKNQSDISNGVEKSSDIKFSGDAYLDLVQHNASNFVTSNRPAGDVRFEKVSINEKEIKSGNKVVIAETCEKINKIEKKVKLTNHD